MIMGRDSRRRTLEVIIRVFSLLIYAVTFVLSYQCLCAAQIDVEKNVSKNRIIYLWLAILLPCILAGLRADTVGVDVGVYVVRDVKYGAISQSLKQLQG